MYLNQQLCCYLLAKSAKFQRKTLGDIRTFIYIYKLRRYLYRFLRSRWLLVWDTCWNHWIWAENVVVMVFISYFHITYIYSKDYKRAIIIYSNNLYLSPFDRAVQSWNLALEFKRVIELHIMYWSFFNIFSFNIVMNPLLNLKKHTYSYKIVKII